MQAPNTAGIQPDAYEPNNSRATAYDLREVEGTTRTAVTGNVNGVRIVDQTTASGITLDDLTIHNVDDVDYFRFETVGTGAAGHRVALDLLGQGNVEMRLLNAPGNEIGGSFSLTDHEEISLDGLLPGEYFVMVFGEPNGNYRLLVDAPERPDQEGNVEADDYEPNNTLNTPTDLRAVEGRLELVGLSIHEAGDDDFFVFQTLGDSTQLNFVSIEFKNDQGDLNLELLDADGNVLDSSNGTSDREVINLAGRFTGTFGIRVWGNDGAINPDYTLVVNGPAMSVSGDHAEPDAFESNDTAATAYDLRQIAGLWSAGSLSIHSPTDVDWFRFKTVGMGEQGHFVEASFQHNLGDIDMTLYDVNGNEIGSSNSAANRERIDLENRVVGDYFVRLFGYSEATNPQYLLTIQAPEPIAIQADHLEPNNHINQATLVYSDTLNHTLSGYQAVDGLSITKADADYFHFTTLNPGTEAHGISLRFLQGNGDLNAELLDDQHQVVVTANSITDNEFISLDGIDPGSYNLHVFGVTDAVNRYNVIFDTPVSDSARDDWTIMIYVTASDLEAYAFDDVNEMEAAVLKLPGSVNIATYWDQSSSLNTYATGDGTQPAWGTAGRAIITGDTNPDVVTTTFEIETQEQDSGDPAVLRSFINWATQRAPANNYALILWDHGAGPLGFNFDNSDGVDASNLTTEELVSVLQNQSVAKMNLVAFDACLMATASVGYSLRNLTDVFVASQEVIGARGFDYTTLFETIESHPSAVDAEALASAFVLSYENQYSGNLNGWDTASAIRTSGYASLAAAIKVFTDAVATATPDELNAIRAARNAAVGYDYEFLRDLGGFMNGTKTDDTISPTIRNAADGVAQLINNMVVQKSNDRRNSSGISIMSPFDGAGHIDFYTTEFTNWDVATGWTSFLHQLGPTNTVQSSRAGGRAITLPDWAESNGIPADAFNLGRLVGAGNVFNRLNLHTNADLDWFRFTIESTESSLPQVTVAPADVDTFITVKIYDSTGTRMLGNSAGAGAQVVSLDGLMAGAYFASVSSDNGDIAAYSVQIDAPSGDAADDFAGDNGTLDKAFSLGLINNALMFSGLGVADGSADYLTFETPRLYEPNLYELFITVPRSVEISAELLDADANRIGSAEGSGTLSIEYMATGRADVYTLVVYGPASDGGTGYNLRFSNANDPPTINDIESFTISGDPGPQTVNFSGVTAGAQDTQVVRITASSSNTNLVPHPTVSYVSPSNSGSLEFTPVARESGLAVITLTLTDTGSDGQLDTQDDATATSQFTVTIIQTNDVSIGSVTIVGDANEGELLTVNISSMAGEEVLADGISYQWQRNDNAIDSATENSYTLTREDIGSTITITASYTDAFGNPHSVTSSATAPIALATSPGDVDNDGQTNNLDITPFITALQIGGSIGDPSQVDAFLAQVPGGSFAAADASADGLVNNLDITPFISLLSQSASAVNASYAATASVQRAKPTAAILATAAVRRSPLPRPAAYTHPLGDTGLSDTIETVDIFAGW